MMPGPLRPATSPADATMSIPKAAETTVVPTVGGSLPWLDDPASEGLEVFAEFGSLPALIETVESASDEDLVASRSLARITLDGVAALSRIADSFAGTDNAVGLAAVEAFRDSPFTAVWLPSFIIAAGRSATLGESVREVAGNLSKKILPLDQRARDFAALPDDQPQERLPGLSKLPFAEQARLKRLIIEYRKAVGPAQGNDHANRNASLVSLSRRAARRNMAECDDAMNSRDLLSAITDGSGDCVTFRREAVGS